MFKKLFIFGLTVFSLGLFFLTSNSVHALTLDVTDEPVDEITVPGNNDEGNENEETKTEKDEIVIIPNTKNPIVSDNSSAQKDMHNQKMEYAHFEKYADALWENNGIIVDMQCYIKGKENGDSSIKIATDCYTTDYKKLSEILKPNEEQTNWFKKNIADLKENAGILFETLASWVSETFGD